MKVNLVLVAGVLSITFGVNAAEQPSKDVDLMAAYCIPIAKQSVVLANEMLQAAEAQSQDSTREAAVRNARQRVEVANAHLSRLQRYLDDPRVVRIDSSALAAAMQRGEADYSAMATGTDDSSFRSCSAQCVQAATSGKNLNVEECTRQCAPPSVRSVMDRVRVCNRTTWLPF